MVRIGVVKNYTDFLLIKMDCHLSVYSEEWGYRLKANKKDNPL